MHSPPEGGQPRIPGAAAGLSLRERTRNKVAESSGARLVDAVNRSRSGLCCPALGSRAGAALRCTLEPARRRSWQAGNEGRARPGHNEGAAGPARARRRLFRNEALPLQRPSATAVIRAFQPQMWA